ncbi:MAG: AIPR family protein [Candidatus Acidiferrales bacterium]
MYDQKQLFDFMQERIRDVGAQYGSKPPQAFGRWFAQMYFDNPQSLSISDGSGDGKVDLFFQTNNGNQVSHYILNTKFTEKYGTLAPVSFYDEINRFWQAFVNKANRPEYLNLVRPEFRPMYKKLFNYRDNGNGHLYFVTNCRRNEKQYATLKTTEVQIFHLEEVLQFMADYLEDAMPRTPSMLLTGISTVLSADKRDTEVPTSIVFARLADFLKYMEEEDPYGLLFARNVRLSLGNTEVNQEIRDTYKHAPTEFAFSNNGITMLCERHTHDPGKQEITIDNPRVVNGSQTLHSIRDSGATSSTARVMLRIIEIPPLSPNDFSEQATKRRKIIDKISIRSNRQNQIKKWNLVSNDDFQHSLARFFRKKRLYYERRSNEWSYRRTELKGLGIGRGPDIKWLTQLIASDNSDKKQLGPAAAKSRLGELFDGEAYEVIKRTKPETAYELYLFWERVERCIKQLASTKRYIAHFGWQAQFVLFSLCVKAFRSAGIEFGAAQLPSFLESSEISRHWLAFCKLGIDQIRTEYRKQAKKYKATTYQDLTLANYFKSPKNAARILDRPVPVGMVKLARQITR